MSDSVNNKIRSFMKSLSGAADRLRKAAEPEEPEIEMNTAPVIEDFFDEADNALLPKDDLYDIQINYSEDEKMEFPHLDSYIKAQPPKRQDPTREPEPEAPKKDYSISFDDDETDSGEEASEEDEFEVDFGEDESEAELEEELYEPAESEAEPEEAEETEPEEAEEEPEEDVFSMLSRLGIGMDYDEPEEEPEEPEYDAGEEPEYETEYEPEEEPEAEPEPEIIMPERDEPEEDNSDDELYALLESLGISLEEPEEAEPEYYEQPEPAETETSEDYTEEYDEYDEYGEAYEAELPEAEPEPEYIPEEASEPEPEEEEDIDDILARLGIELSEDWEEPEPEPEIPAKPAAEDRASAYDKAFPSNNYDDDESDRSRFGIDFSAYDERAAFIEEAEPEEEELPEEEPLELPAGVSSREAQALAYAKRIRERGFDFDAVFFDEDEADGNELSEQLIDISGEGLGQEFDSRFDMSRPNMGIIHGVEEADVGLSTEHEARLQIPSEPEPEKKKSVFSSLLNRFGINRPEKPAEPVYSATEEAEMPASAYSTGDTYEDYAGEEEYSEEPEQYEQYAEPAEDAPGAYYEPGNETEDYPEQPEVSMAEGFSEAEMAAAYAQYLNDTGADNAEYADNADYSEDNYDYDDPDGDDFMSSPYVEDSFPSFREFVVSDIMSLVYKFTGKGRKTTATVSEDEDDLGPEADAYTAMLHYSGYRKPLELRLRIAAPVLVLMLWLSLELPVPGMLQNTATAAAALMAMQFCVMLIALDIVTNAVLNAVRGKLGADGLAVIACLATSLDALLVATKVSSAHLPLCVLSSISIYGALFASMLSAKSLRKTMRVPAIGKKAYVVTAETDLTGKGNITALKSDSSTKGFVRCAEQAAPDEWFYLRFSPYILIVLAVIAVIVTLITKHIGNFVYVFSAVLAPAVPFTALVSFAMPFFVSAVQIFGSSAAIAGWSGVSDIGRSRDIIITDRDLFPEECVKVDEVRVFNDVDDRQFIAYAGTMIIASGSCAAPAMIKYMKENNVNPRPVEGYEYLPGGGLKGVIDGEVVLLGNADMMRLMHIAVNAKHIKPNTIVVAVNNCLYGFIDVDYSPDRTVRPALLKLMASNRHPIFAVRDFNVTPALIAEKYDVATDGYDFPGYIERFRLSSASPEKKNQPSAVICKGGLAPLIATVNAGRSVYITTRINMYLTTLAAVIGVLLAIFQFVTAGTVSLTLLAMFEIICALPVMIISVFMKL